MKFLVNDVVVDVSYETLGGLCAVNFLQELGMFIGRQDLFKRSVILVITQKCAVEHAADN